MADIPVKKTGVFDGVRSALTVVKVVVKYAGLIMVVVGILVFAVESIEKWLAENDKVNS